MFFEDHHHKEPYAGLSPTPTLLPQNMHNRIKPPPDLLPTGNGWVQDRFAKIRFETQLRRSLQGHVVTIAIVVLATPAPPPVPNHKASYVGVIFKAETAGRTADRDEAQERIDILNAAEAWCFERIATSNIQSLLENHVLLKEGGIDIPFRTKVAFTKKSRTSF